MSTVQETSNKEICMRFHDVVNSGDLEQISRAMDELIEPDAVLHTPLPITATGPDALKQVWAVLLRVFPDVHVAIEDVIAEGDKVVVRSVVTGTHRSEHLGIAATGKSVRYDEIFVLRIVNGRIVETRGVVDMFTQLRQLGAFPA